MFLLQCHSPDHAMLVGTKHLVTFDGKMYDLPSKCSVLLAKDFVHNAFTVILNEETKNSRSLYVEMNQTVISIYPRLKVGRASQTFFIFGRNFLQLTKKFFLNINTQNIDQKHSQTRALK